MDRLLDSIIMFIKRNQEMNDEQSAIVRYGLEMIILKSLFFIGAMAIGVLMHSFWECGIFFLFFSILRSYAGGYHAKTRRRCFVQSMLTFLIVLVTLKCAEVMPHMSIVIVVLAIISAIVLWLISPVDCKNKQLETDEKIVFQKKTRVCLCIEMIIAIIAVTIGYCGISHAVMLAHIVEGILATMGLAFRNGNEEVNY